ncbi:MAG: DNA/RNA helicase domain-containing protein [Rhodospirillales bacterium]
MAQGPGKSFSSPGSLCSSNGDHHAAVRGEGRYYHARPRRGTPSFDPGTDGDGRFSGTRWQNVRQEKAKLYLKNAYRVLMTRARQGLIVYIPPGDQQDPTRLPEFYDETVEYLTRCGIPIIG